MANTTKVKKISTVGVKDSAVRRVLEELSAHIATIELELQKGA